MASDARALNRLLAVEYHALAGYTASTPLLDGDAAGVARQCLGQEVLHTDRLISLIQRAGGKPLHPQASYDLGRPQSPEQVMRLLLSLEQMQLAAYANAIPALAAGPLRAQAASILADQAQHAVLWRLQLGEKPAQSAFVSGRG